MGVGIIFLYKKGLESERVLAQRKQCGTLFSDKRAERRKRGQTVCKAHAAADGKSLHPHQETPYFRAFFLFYDRYDWYDFLYAFCVNFRQ